MFPPFTPPLGEPFFKKKRNFFQGEHLKKKGPQKKFFKQKLGKIKRPLKNGKRRSPQEEGKKKALIGTLKRVIPPKKRRKTARIKKGPKGVRGIKKKREVPTLRTPPGDHMIYFSPPYSYTYEEIDKMKDTAFKAIKGLL